MKTAVEFYREELNALISLRETKFKTEQEIFEQAKEIEKEQNKYSMADLRNAYRWGASAESATSEHFSEFVNNLKQQEQ